MKFISSGSAVGVSLLALAWSSSALAAPSTVTVQNQTRQTKCAEEDNVSLVLSATGLRKFKVEALPPTYLASIEKDTTAPDFSNCNFDGGVHPSDPRYTFKERRVVLHDGPRWQIVGLTLPSFWRPDKVPVSVGGRRFDGTFHLVQVFAKNAAEPKAKPLEAVVMYPNDGYWRLKPLPQPRFGDGVYGSSFVMGPVVEAGRPIARIKSIAIQPQPLAFRIQFADGSSAKVDLAEISEARTALDVDLQPSPHATSRARARPAPFAVLRSMYVAPDNADMSQVSWASKPGASMSTASLPDVRTLDAADVRFGRTTVSRHNTSAPDIRFSGFEATPPSSNAPAKKD